VGVGVGQSSLVDQARCTKHLLAHQAEGKLCQLVFRCCPSRGGAETYSGRLAMPDTQTYAAISDVVKTYVNGMCLNDPAKLRDAMHEKSCCIGHYEGGLEWDSREAFIAAVDAAVDTPDPAPWHAVNAISIAGDVATVQVENIWLGMHYDDTLTLLRHDDRWVIVAKVFFLRPGK